MGTTNFGPPVSPDAEPVLRALDRARDPQSRTRIALKSKLGLAGQQIHAVLADLLMSNFIQQEEDYYNLTRTGRDYLKQLENKPAQMTYIENLNHVTQEVMVSGDSKVGVTGVLDSKARSVGNLEVVTAKPTGHNGQYTLAAKDGFVNGNTVRACAPVQWVAAQVHPARKGCAPPIKSDTERFATTPPVRFMLAYLTMRDALPIPVFDQDRLGRLDAIGHVKPDLHIALPDAGISAAHCRFLVRKSKSGAGYELLIEDLESTNGVQVNDVYIEPKKPAPLRHGSRLVIGSTSFVVIEVPVL